MPVKMGIEMRQDIFLYNDRFFGRNRYGKLQHFHYFNITYFLKYCGYIG